MKFLLDTNVLSEVRRPDPDRGVLRWLDEVDEDRTHISVISLAEIRRGIALLDDGRRKNLLSHWLEHDLPQRFEGKVFDIGPPVALIWGDLTASAQKQGRKLHAMDGLIAATALAEGLTLVTRNIRDFDGFGIALYNPWTS